MMGIGIPLNNHIDLRLGAAYNYQVLKEYIVSPYYSPKLESHYNRFSIGAGFHKTRKACLVTINIIFLQ